MQQQLTDLAQLLRFQADQSISEGEELLREARRLEEEAEQLDAEGRRWAQAEAEAESARQRQANAAKANTAAASDAASAHTSSTPNTTPSAESQPAKPDLVFDPIETTPVPAPVENNESLLA